jgi:AmmeMemoRadiSam system protein B
MKMQVKSEIPNPKSQVPNLQTNKFWLSGFWVLFIVCNLCIFNCNLISYAEDIKQPNVSGSFYPDEAGELSGMIYMFMDAARPQEIKEDVFALISPHAGYGFSGQAAAYGYKVIAGRSYKTVVIIGPSHYYGFAGVSVYPKGKFRTPLGDLEIDTAFTEALLFKDSEIVFDPSAFAKEHSVEMQLPFLQKALTGFKIVPIVMGDCSLSTCKKLASLLKAAIASRKDILIVASTDMYHGYDYDEGEIVDSLTLSCLKKMDAETLYYGLRDGRLQLCGGLPVVSVLMLARELGYNALTVLNYTDSAIVTGNKVKGRWTVGYASCAIHAAAADSQKSEGKRPKDG